MRKRRYRFSSTLKQDRCQEVYNLAFNFTHPAYTKVFASVSMNRAVVYELAEGGGICPLQSYVDENKEENFYALTWARDGESGTPLLVIGGINGVMRILDCHLMSSPRTLKGHGNSINDLKTSPVNPSLILSASKDESVRLWNLQTGVCVAIFAGYAGHRNEVLSCGFHPGGKYIISSGMDNSVKLWSLQGKVREHITLSFIWDEGRHGSCTSFPTLYEQYPEFSSAEIHTNYVDCAQYFGDAVLSKSIESKIVLWVRDDPESGTWDPWNRPAKGHNLQINSLQRVAPFPGPSPRPEDGVGPLPTFEPLPVPPLAHEDEGSVEREGGEFKIQSTIPASGSLTKSTGAAEGREGLLGIPLEKRKDQIRIVREFNYDRSDIWFLRFSLDFFMGFMAVGNRDGKIFVWDMRTLERPALLQKISHHSCNSACRQAALSFDGSTIVSAHDDGSIWRWDETDQGA